MADRLSDTLKHTRDGPIAFIDLEASGLGVKSWPIEIGWGFIDQPAKAILVKPADHWSQSEWDPKAAALHGIAQATLAAEGVEAREVCDRLNDALSDAKVYSDAPGWDGFWLYQLYSAGGIRAAFTVYDFADLMGAISPEKITALIREAEKTFPHIHRAAPDVEHMRKLYQLVQDDF